jgi:chromosome partitioning protein
MNESSFIASFLNRKGGVGKTSSVFHLAGAYALEGRKVLVCDLDPQASLSQGFFGPSFIESLPRQVTVAALFDDSLDPTPGEIVHPTLWENLFIVPASNDLTDHNTPRPEDAGNQEALRDFLTEVRADFDLVLIDCPPNLQLCSWAALLASDFVVVPVIPEDFSSQGLIYVQQAIDAAMIHRNPRLRLLGYMLTMYNRSLGIHRAYETSLRRQYGDLVLATAVPLATAFKESVTRRRPVGMDKSRSVAAESVKVLASELLVRAPVFASRPAAFHYAGNRRVQGVATAQEQAVIFGVDTEEAA